MSEAYEGVQPSATEVCHGSMSVSRARKEKEGIESRLKTPAEDCRPNWKGGSGIPRHLLDLLKALAHLEAAHCCCTEGKDT